MAEAPRILLEHHLKRVKLPTFLREYEKLARQCAAEGLDHVQFLARLVELELIDELWPRVGDGLREGGGVSWGVTKPPGLQARSDTP